MGVAQPAAFIIGGLVVFAGLVVVGALRMNSRRHRDRPDTIDQQLAAAEQTYRTELHAAPIVGVPYDTVRSDGSHDLYPHMSDHARDAVVASLNEWLAWPARERTS